ncbi:MAG: ABC transporter permease [Lysobacteraceae bacterium]|nr:MAG: ABC transporter permease [Xanthomonadaceae bacterium]
MFGYYLDLALRSLKRNKALTVVMVLALALGIGACMTTLTVYYVLSGDPIPSKSGQLFYPRIEPRSMNGFLPGDEPELQMTRFDAETLLRQKRADRQAVMSAGGVVIDLENSAAKPFSEQARYASADFFPMFDVPFRHGNPWTAEEDESRAQVAVISKALNDRLFAGGNSVGKTLRLNQASFRVIGVLEAWQPNPRFYDLTNQRFGEGEQVFLPFSTSRALDFGSSGSMNCWGNTNSEDEGPTGPNAPCAWLQYWVELDGPAKVAEYRRYLQNYSEEQREAGRFERPTNVRLHSVMEWLDDQAAVPPDVRLQAWLAFGFLAVCLLNTIGLLLAKFLRRAPDIGVRRALGASRRDIFAQCLIEAGVVGMLGGLLGIGLAWLGLWAVRQQPTDYAGLAHLDPAMLLTSFALALGASLLAGLLPAWRACQITPAIQLKSQ